MFRRISLRKWIRNDFAEHHAYINQIILSKETEVLLTWIQLRKLSQWSLKGK